MSTGISREVVCPKCKGVGEVYDAWAPRVRPDGWETEPEECDCCFGKGHTDQGRASQYRRRGW